MKKGFVGIVAIIIAIVILAGGVKVTVPAGHRGVLLNWSAFSGEVLQPGWNWKIPYKQSVVMIDVRQVKHQVKVSCYTADTQTIEAVIALNYHFIPAEVGIVYDEIGYSNTSDDRKSVQSKVIDPKLAEFMKAVTPLYDADDIIANREVVRNTVEAKLAAHLLKNHLQLDTYSLVNFKFLDEYEAAIESKRTAYQRAEEALFDLDRIKTEADQRIAQATGEAEAIRIQAESINSQGGENYVALKAVEKWNGRLPTQYVPGSALPFINAGVPSK